MIRICVEHYCHKDIHKIFDKLADHANYKHFPTIDDSVLIEAGQETQNGEGALRKIVAKPVTLIERITVFEPPHRMHYQIEKTTPIDMQHEKGEITLEQTGDLVLITWISEGSMKLPLLGPAADMYVQFKAARSFKTILKHIEASV